MIYVVRHGQSEDNVHNILGYWRDTPLTRKGQSQAKKLAAFIKKKKLKFSQIYVSPLGRARETAEILRKKAGLELVPWKIVEDLIERNGGAADGCTWEVVAKLYPKKVIVSGQGMIVGEVPESEPIKKLMVRARRVLKWLNKEYPGKNILLATHGDFGQALYGAFYGLSWVEAMSEFWFGNAEMLLLRKGMSRKRARIFIQK